MNNYSLTPKVDETQEFIEIANDFSNPLELVREAISNAFDAKAREIEILFNATQEYGETISLIKLRDNGAGMKKDGLQSFFDLGNSLRREDPESIGEKGHGTKVYFNSGSIQVTTFRNGTKLEGLMDQPFKSLHGRKIPEVKVSETATNQPNGTEIIIKRYHNNRRDKFTHSILKDYILWFTKFGSIETALGIDKFSDVKLFLKGLDQNEQEVLKFGHIFPDESPAVEKLFEQHLVKAPDYYCKRITKTGHLRHHPEIEYQAVFSIEGKQVKYRHNPMLRRPGYQAPRGAYTFQERYGLWLCKDFIPIQRKNEWITYKGYEYTRFHAFLNCQGLRLTANRGSVDNTPSDIMNDIQEEVRSIYDQIVQGDDWRSIEWLEEEASSYSTIEKEKKDFGWRISKIEKADIVNHKNRFLVKPERESGVFALLVQLAILEPGLFPFQILDYDTHSGLDIIVKGDHTTPIFKSKLYYVELKYYLSGNFNHSFENLHSIVCWETEIKNDDTIEDISGQQRKMKIVPPANERDYTRYFLDHPRDAHRIEVFVLKDYLREKLGLEFRPRSKEV